MKCGSIDRRPQFRVVQHKEAELDLASWTVLISFWGVNLRQLKLELAKENKRGKACTVVAWRSAELFTNKSERVEAKGNVREMGNGTKLRARRQ
jgi:hypothetical protein